LTLDQGKPGCALALQEQEIEGEEYKVVGMSLIHGGLESTEGADSIFAERTKLTVNIGRLYRQRLQGVDRVAVAVRPIQAGSREELDAAIIQARMHAVAVVFDLVQPIAARWHFLDKAG
jgi:hypothetical protein